MSENLTWCKEVILGEMHTLDYPLTNKQNEDGSWIINYNLNPAAMTADGYTQWTEEELEAWHAQYDPPVPPYTRQRCTKYQLVTCLRNHFPSLLEQLQTSYSSNPTLQFYWNTVQDLDRTNPDFQGFVSSLGIPKEQISEIFEKIEGEEPALS